MKTLFLSVAAVFASLFSTTAQAADWWMITGTAEMIRFADASSIIGSSSKKIAWVRWENAVPDERGSKYMLIRMSYDCDQRSFFPLEIIVFDAQNKNLADITNPNQPVSYAPPESMNLEEVQFVCGYSKDAGQSGRIENAIRVPDGVTPTQLTEYMVRKFHQ